MALAAVALTAAYGSPAAAAVNPIFETAPQPISKEQMAAEYVEETGKPYDEALRRMTIQERAGGLIEELKKELGSTFGGAWIDQESGQVKVGLLEEQDRSTIERSLSVRGLEVDKALVPVKSSREDLEAAQYALLGELGPAIASGKVSSDIDDAENAVVVGLGPKASSPDWDAARSLRNDFGRGRFASAPPRPPANPSPFSNPAASAIAQPAKRRVVDLKLESTPDKTAESAACSSESCGLPLRAGVKVTNGAAGQSSGGNCSAGFIGYWVSGSTTYFFMMTAGHCIHGAPHVAWRSRDVDYGTSYTIGNRWTWRFGTTPGNPSYLPTFDAGIISMDYAYHWTDVIVKPSRLWMKGWPGGQYWAVTSQGIAYQGEFGCRTGYASNYTCGTVSSTSANRTIDGVAVTNLVEVPGACPTYGDSGGAFIDGGRALGITSAGWPTVDSCTAGLYAHVWDIGYWLGVWVWI